MSYTVTVKPASGLDTVLDIYDGDGTKRASNDDAGDGSLGSLVEWTAERAGAHSIQIRSYLFEESGSFTLTVSKSNDQHSWRPLSIISKTTSVRRQRMDSHR